MDRRELHEIYKDLQTCKRGKEARRLHKELKEHGDGLPFTDRYPNFPLVFSIISLLLVLLRIFLPCILR